MPGGEVRPAVTPRPVRHGRVLHQRGRQIAGDQQRHRQPYRTVENVDQLDSRAFTKPLALPKSIWPANLPLSTAMTLPMSFMPAGTVSAAGNRYGPRAGVIHRARPVVRL